MLRRRRANARVPLRALRLQRSAGEPDLGKRNLQAAEQEKSAARDRDRKKQNPREAELERNGAPEPGRRKPNPRAAVLNFKENLLGRPGNLHQRQQIRAKEPRKAPKRVLTGSQKGPRARLLHRDRNSNNNRSIKCARFPRSLVCARETALLPRVSFELLRQLYQPAGISRRSARPRRKGELFRTQTGMPCAYLCDHQCIPGARMPAHRRTRG